MANSAWIALLPCAAAALACGAGSAPHGSLDGTREQAPIRGASPLAGRSDGGTASETTGEGTPSVQAGSARPSSPAGTAAAAGPLSPLAAPIDPAADNAASAFVWATRPELKAAPSDGVYGAIGAHPLKLTAIKIGIDKKDWTFEAKTDDDAGLGPTLVMKGQPTVRVFRVAWDDKSPGFFQVPKVGETARTFNETTSASGPHASVVSITSLTLGTRKTSGKASGHFVATWEIPDLGPPRTTRKAWAGGTFVDVPVIQI